MLPPVKVKRTGASIDFLAIRRQEREKFFQEYDERMETPPIANDKTLHKKIHQKNLLLNEQLGGHMQNENFIKTNEKVGDMLLKSVKNKLDEFLEYLV